MAWEGWLEFAGVEIVNASRTEAYARHAGAGWFKAAIGNTDLVSVLDHGRYDSPLQDEPDWTDPDVPESYAFLGAYPLSVQGLEDSTRTATVTESTLDGGVVGRPRAASKSVVMQLLLLGTTSAGTEYGHRWLKAALTGGPCIGRDDSDCGGTDLCYLASEPCVDWTSCDDATACLPILRRNLRRVVSTVGPVVNSKRDLTDGSAAWIVSCTLTCGDPFEYGSEIPLIDNFMKDGVEVPYVGGVIPPGGDFDLKGHVQDDPSCSSSTTQPVFDPLCPTVIAPPSAPDISLACFKFPVNYRRRQVTIPEQFIPLYGEVVPFIEIRAHGVEVRNMRLRFFADPHNFGDPDLDPCAFCGDIVFSYIPAGSVMTFNGADQVVYIQTTPNGPRRRADSLVYGSDGKPFDWPALTCGSAYIMTVDLPQTQDPPVFDLTLIPRVT